MWFYIDPWQQSQDKLKNCRNIFKSSKAHPRQLAVPLSCVMIARSICLPMLGLELLFSLDFDYCKMCSICKVSIFN